MFDSRGAEGFFCVVSGKWKGFHAWSFRIRIEVVIN